MRLTFPVLYLRAQTTHYRSPVILKALDSLAERVSAPRPQQFFVRTANMAPAAVVDDGKVTIDNTDDTMVVGDARLKRHAGW